MIDMISNDSTIKDDCSGLAKDGGSGSGLGKVGQYLLTRLLGETHTYPVYLATCGVSKEEVVVKLIEEDDDAFSNECRIFDLPEHTNIVRLRERINRTAIQFGSELASSNDQNASEPETAQNALIMEYLENGNLFNYLLRRPLPEKIARFYFEQVLDAVEHLHCKEYCHLDLKLENILLDDNFCVKLSDFGFATKVTADRPLYSKAGTPSYRPPEMWKYGPEYKGYDGCKTDIFQLGAILYILIVGAPAFVEANSSDFWYKPALMNKWDTFWSFKERSSKSKKHGPKSFDLDFKVLISELLSADPAERPTIAEIRKSDWFTKVQPATLKEVKAEMAKRKRRMN